MIEGALLVDPTLATATPFSLFGILRTETDDACGHDKVVELAVAAVVGPWLPAASWTELALSRATNVPATVQSTDTVIVVPEDADGVNEHPVAVPVFEKSADDKPLMVSLNVSVKDEDNPLLVAEDHDALGAVVSDTGTVTETEAVPPPRVDWAFPAESLAEKAPEAVIDDDTVPPPIVAVDVALTRHVVAFVWTIESILAMFVVAKSLDDNVEQSIASLPVTVKAIEELVEVDAIAARVRVGGVVSAIVTTTDAGDPDTAVCVLPAVSATEKLELLVKVEVRGVPTTAVDSALIVQTVDDVWTIEVIEEMLVNVKSTPLVEDNVVQLIASLPVNVNEIEVEFEDAEVAARVKVGGVVSTTTGV